MESIDSPWETAFKFVLKPRLLLQGVVEYISAWFFTRPWLRSLLLYSPVWILVGSAFGLVSYGAWLDRYTLFERYANWVEEELPTALAGPETASDQSSAGGETPGNEDPIPSGTASAETSATGESVTSGQSPQDEASDTGSQAAGEAADLKGLEELDEVSPTAELLLRRLLQLEQSNSRITYLVALQLARQGRSGQAQQMMRRIAPESGGGFAPAHAWLAVDRLNAHQTTTESDLEILASDLETARRWSGIQSGLLSVYADLLESQGKVNEAMAVLDQAGDRDSNLSIKLANMAARHGHDQRLARVSSDVKAHIKERMESFTATLEDYRHLSNLFLLEKEPEKALLVVREGLKNHPGDEQLRRLQSEAYRIQYLMTAQFNGEQATVNLGLLDAALKSDPSNPAVGIEIARLVAAGQAATPELHAALSQQLASGQATAITHILLSNRKLMDGELTEAVPHLELALRQAPNTPMVMNNLALALARTDRSQLERALKLSQSAIAASPENPGYFDTLGEIRDLSGDKLGAIESYEAAIGLDANNNDVRQKLAKLYRELGMTEMASVQEEELKKRQSTTDK